MMPRMVPAVRSLHGWPSIELDIDERANHPIRHTIGAEITDGRGARDAFRRQARLTISDCLYRSQTSS